MFITKISDLKIALIGASHWHVPLYLKGLKDLNVVAISDEHDEVVQRYTAQIGCKGYSNYRDLITKEKPDFIFAFASHNCMKELSLYLIDNALPFSMEKPMGLNKDEVNKIAEIANVSNAFIAIPFVWRYSDTVQLLKEQILNTKIHHLSFKFIAGPPSRYLESSKWMLSKKTAGGGCMTNLAPHFLDMALYLTDAKSAQVLSTILHYGDEYDIELYGSSMLKLSTGASLLIETGYNFPMDNTKKRENRWTIVTENGYYILAENQLEIREYGKPVDRISLNTDSDEYYPKYVRRTLTDFIEGQKPRASIQEMLIVREILDKINFKASQN